MVDGRLAGLGLMLKIGDFPLNFAAALGQGGYGESCHGGFLRLPGQDIKGPLRRSSGTWVRLRHNIRQLRVSQHALYNAGGTVSAVPIE